MPKRLKFKDPRPSSLDIDEFYKLTDILFETLREKHAACARILGISVRTWQRWEKEPPEWPYWNMVIRYVLRSIIPHLDARGYTKAHKQRLIKALSELPKDDLLLGQIEDLAVKERGSVAHLRKLLSKDGLYWDQIRLPRYNGGYSTKSLRSAARILEVKMTQEGYGESKRSFWELPDEED